MDQELDRVQPLLLGLLAARIARSDRALRGLAARREQIGVLERLELVDQLGDPAIRGGGALECLDRRRLRLGPRVTEVDGDPPLLFLRLAGDMRARRATARLPAPFGTPRSLRRESAGRSCAGGVGSERRRGVGGALVSFVRPRMPTLKTLAHVVNLSDAVVERPAGGDHRAQASACGAARHGDHLLKRLRHSGRRPPAPLTQHARHDRSRERLARAHDHLTKIGDDPRRPVRTHDDRRCGGRADVASVSLPG